MAGPHHSAPDTSLTTTTIDALRTAGEEGNADAVAELLAPDVVLHSPMSATKVFSGREAVTALHRDIFAILDDVVTSASLVRGDTGVFAFRAQVRGVEIEAMSQVRVDKEGQILDYTIFVRPLPGLVTLFATSRRELPRGDTADRPACSWHPSAAPSPWFIAPWTDWRPAFSRSVTCVRDETRRQPGPIAGRSSRRSRSDLRHTAAVGSTP